MEAFVITATLFGSFATAFYIQRAALEGLFRMMDPNRRERQYPRSPANSCTICASRGAGSSARTDGL